jgi:hypothetical protein
VQSDWPGEAKQIKPFQLYFTVALDCMYITLDKAYLPSSVECGGQILTPYRQH